MAFTRPCVSAPVPSPFRSSYFSLSLFKKPLKFGHPINTARYLRRFGDGINAVVLFWVTLCHFKTSELHQNIVMSSSYCIIYGFEKKKITSKRQLNKTLEFTSRLPRHVIHLLIFLCLICFLFRPNTTPGYHHVQACFAKQSRVLHVSFLLSGHMLVWMYGGTTRQYCCLFAVQHQTLHGKQSTKRKDLRVPSTSNGRCGKPSRSCDVYMESWWAKTLGLRKVFCTLPNNKEIESRQAFWLISVHWY